MGRQKQVKQFKVGDFIFAKVRGFRPWPSRILDVEDKTYHVYFYGSCNIAKVKPDQVFDYKKNKTRLAELKEKQKKCGLFKEAMDQMERSRANPSDDPHYFEMKSQFTIDKGPSKPAPTKAKTLKRKYTKRIQPFVHITGDSDSE